MDDYFLEVSLMAGTIATLLSDSKNLSSTPTKGPVVHAYNEAVELQSVADPTLASPYLKASAASTVAANGGSTGNLTITMNFPKYGVAVTTGNIAYNASVATVQTAVDSALATKVILATYNADHVKASDAGLISGNVLTLTANGTTVNGAHMVVTTANVDMDVAAPAVAVVTVGTQNRPAEAFLYHFGVIEPVSSVVAQGITPTAANYQLLSEGDINAHSLSPGLLDAVVRDVAANEDNDLAVLFRSMIGCI